MIRRITSILLSVIIIISLSFLPLRTEAVSADSKAGIVRTSGSKLNVRSGPSTANATVAQLGNGSYITLISKSGSWWKVEYAKGQYGYCHADYLSVASGNTATVATKSGALNVRSGAGTANPRIGSLSKGETVIVLSIANGWSRILYHGTKTGYVSSGYLSGKPASVTYPALSLAVPSFKQTDSRWANVIIGQSGKTMAKIGCATTAIAMMESFRTGSTIYPNTMAKKLSYTASGSVYWPSHYNVATNHSGYLSALYQLLKAGKPVLLGATNNYGGQHWVVITGFLGGSALNASAFTIHDPGSNSRTNLQQFFNDYPNFYKYFHY